MSLQADKVNYMLSSVFFLANRLAKANQGLAEFDRFVKNADDLSRREGKKSETDQKSKDFSDQLDDILAEYF